MNETTKWKLNTPVAFLIFNRPDTTEKVFTAIAKARPPKLLVVADGPRADRPMEKEKCIAARAIMERVDWDCEVFHNYSETNLGCKKRISSGLDWVFDTVDEAIVLEDDCLPSSSFFLYCQELLQRYRHEPRVMAISGVNFQFGAHRIPYSYYFSRYNHCWGWAGWSRSWKFYDDTMADWPRARDEGILEKVLGDREAARYWTGAFDTAYRGDVDSWAYRWTLSTWLAGGVAALPVVNLVSNIGFGREATHTRGRSSLAFMETGELDFPLVHPPVIAVETEADRRTFCTCYRPGLTGRIRGRLEILFGKRGGKS